ncbi:MAG: aminotransferase class I/II-fold pyridoxal phosphate-dependent enzyme [Candidatus Micrarchaeia archaeon]
MGIPIEYSERLKKLPPYLFADIEKKIAEKKKAGVDIISLGIGDPDIPTPEPIRKKLSEEAFAPNTHNYSLSQGEEEFREAVAEWYKKRFGVSLDPKKEVIALIGSKEGLANIARAFVNPKDVVLVPDPAYPVYAQGATTLCDGVPVKFPLLEENDFLPVLDSLDAKNAKMMYLNYPNNPTGAVATREFLKEAVHFAEEKGIILCYDNAYSEFTFDDYIAPSALEFGMDCIEFHSCSKTFSMTGDRIGFAVGNADIVEGLRKVKTQIDSGPSVYVQRAAIAALNSYKGKERPPFVNEIMLEYERRRDVFVRGLNKIGLKCKKPKATFYIWLRVRGSSVDFVNKLLDVGVVATPGIGFGEYGEGFVRFALTQPIERIKEALERMEKAV